MQRQKKSQIQCQTCGQHIPQINYPIHAIRCSLKKQSKIQAQKSSLISSSLLGEKQKKKGGLSRIRKNKIFQQQNSLLNNNDFEQKIPCSFCGYKQSLTELDTHPATCEGRQATCMHCGEMYPDELMQEHQNLCPANNHYNQDVSSYNLPQQSDQQQYELYQQPHHHQLSHHHPNPRSRNTAQPIDRLMNLISLIDNMRVLFRNLEIQQQQQGMKKQSMEKLKKFKYKQKQKQQEQEICTICYCKMENGQNCLQLRCKHIYHNQCISKWLEQSTKCPVCKHDQNLQKK